MISTKGYERIINELADAGYEGYLVGGCVRDMLLGIEPRDYDIATDAAPDAVCSVFKDCSVLKTGLKHGTVTILLEGQPFEVTTYRSDGRYSDGRHPDEVFFSKNLATDLSRRDFTVNAMAMDLKGVVIDPFGGKRDLKNRLLRSVGNPRERFGEDALRILRALRFSSVLSFEIEENTARAAEELKDMLSSVSRERCFEELKKTLCGENIEDVLLRYWSVFASVIPELCPMKNYDQNNPHHRYTLDKHTAVAVSFVPAIPVLRLAALFHDVGKPSTVSIDLKGISHFYGHAQVGAQLSEKILKDLKSDGQTVETVKFLVLHHDLPPETCKEQVAKRLRRYGVEKYKLLNVLRRADNLAQSEEFDRKEMYDVVDRYIAQLEKENSCFSLSSLAVNGRDLLEEGYAQGPLIGRILELLLDAVLDGKVPNEKNLLLAYVRDGSLYKSV